MSSHDSDKMVYPKAVGKLRECKLRNYHGYILYDNKINKYKKISIKRSQQLLKNYRRTKQDKWKFELFYSVFGLVFFVAKQFKIAHLETQDLGSIGYLTFEKAIVNYKFDRKVPFRVYFTKAVYWEFIRYCKMSGIIKIPLNVLGKVYRILRLKQDHTDDEIFKELKIDPRFKKVFDRVNELNTNINSYDLIEDCTESTDLIDKKDSDYDMFERYSSYEAVEKILGTLSEREQYIIRGYYGLDGSERLTLEDLAKELKISRERVRQLRIEAEYKIRLVLENKKRG